MNPLYLPLDALPSPVPVGAYACTDDRVSGVVMGSTPGSVLICTGEASAWWPNSRVGLDISRPSTIDDHPAHIDGADVAAGMLARAMGLDPSGGWLFSSSVSLSGEPDSLIWYLGTASGDAAFFPGDIPALADIDHTHPDADRLALAAVIRSKPWENR